MWQFGPSQTHKNSPPAKWDSPIAQPNVCTVARSCISVILSRAYDVELLRCRAKRISGGGSNIHLGLIVFWVGKDNREHGRMCWTSETVGPLEMLENIHGGE